MLVCLIPCMDRETTWKPWHAICASVNCGAREHFQTRFRPRSIAIGIALPPNLRRDASTSRAIDCFLMTSSGTWTLIATGGSGIRLTRCRHYSEGRRVGIGSARLLLSPVPPRDRGIRERLRGVRYLLLVASLRREVADALQLLRARPIHRRLKVRRANLLILALSRSPFQVEAANA